MTITFKSNSDVIVYALEKIISFARSGRLFFVASCVWWIAGQVGLDSGLTTFIDNLEIRKRTYQPREVSTKPRDITRLSSIDSKQVQLEESIIQNRVKQDLRLPHIHPERVEKILGIRSVAAAPGDLTEDQRLDRILDSAEKVIQDSYQARGQLQRNRKYPLRQTKTKSKKKRTIKRLQKTKEGKIEAERNQRLLRIRATVIRNLSKE